MCAQFAFVRYGTFDSEVLWDLSSENTDSVMRLQESIDAINYESTLRNTAAGLNAATTQVFSGAPGDRCVPRLCYVTVHVA